MSGAAQHRQPVDGQCVLCIQALLTHVDFWVAMWHALPGKWFFVRNGVVQARSVLRNKNSWREAFELQLLQKHGRLRHSRHLWACVQEVKKCRLGKAQSAVTTMQFLQNVYTQTIREQIYVYRYVHSTQYFRQMQSSLQISGRRKCRVCVFSFGFCCTITKMVSCKCLHT